VGTVRRLYGERPEYLEDMFLPTEEAEAEAAMKGGRRWGKWSESASTSPEHRRREAAEDWEAEPGPPLPAFLRYLRARVRGLFHAPQSVLNKAACIVEESVLSSVVKTNWALLLDQDPDVAGASSAGLIVSSVKAPRQTMGLVLGELAHTAPHVRCQALLHSVRNRNQGQLCLYNV
jgi:hypothetical protein